MYINLLTCIKNAQAARLEKIKVPHTEMDMAIAQILSDNKFIDSAEKKGRSPKRYLEIALRYDKNKSGAIHGLRFLSVPSRRSYIGYRKLRPVRQGYGIAVITTPKGILTNKEAKQQKVGGQALFEIW